MATSISPTKQGSASDQQPRAEAEKFMQMSNDQVVSDLQTSLEHGLSAAEAQNRLAAYGPNEQQESASTSLWTMVLRQFNSSVVYLLLAAACVCAIVHEFLQMTGILLAVFINAGTGFFMEYKASSALKELVKLTGTTIQVLRDGSRTEVSVRDLVPGDIVLLQPGCRVPADLRILQSASLSMDESLVTGESISVYKSSAPSKKNDKGQNIAWCGTVVTSGRGTGVVVATGNNTSLGSVGKLISDADTGATPLESQLEDLGKQLTILTVVLCFALALVGIWHEQNLLAMVETSVALAVAAIPEGLPVIATLALAMGTARMVKKGAIIRRLAAVETLGCTSVICCDKTGTLTENRMTVTDIACDARAISITGTGHETSGQFVHNGNEFQADEDLCLKEALLGCVLCNDAKVERVNDEAIKAHGDPTEVALLLAGIKCGILQGDAQAKYPRLEEAPFDLERKRMSTVHSIGNRKLVYTKGSPEVILSHSDSFLSVDGEAPMSKEMSAWFEQQNRVMGEKGLRVLAIAKTELKEDETLQHVENDRKCTLIALVGMCDRPKPGVKEAIAKCKNAGIRVIMLTGDQALTAQAIGKDLGICRQEGEVLSGADQESSFSSDTLQSATVLARVTPELKLSVVRSLQGSGAVIAMTGDGVNDAPALKQSNIGIAMGKEGTDLAKSVSQMVITDDSFSTIANAVEEGRIIYANIQRAVGYLLTASLASVATVSLSILFDVGLPLTPLQLLWLNLIMHIFPGIGIVMQSADDSIMNQPPRTAGSKILGKHEMIHVAARALAVSCMVLAAIEIAGKTGSSADEKTTIGLATLSLGLLMQAFAWLNPDGVRGSRSFGLNPSMLLNIGLAIILLLAAIYLPGLNTILETTIPSPRELQIIAACSAGSVLLANMLCAVVKFVAKKALAVR